MGAKASAMSSATRGVTLLRRLRLTSYRFLGLLAMVGVLATNGTLFAQAPSKLVLQLHKVVCIDETDSGFLIGERGDDHMILGAITIAPNGRRNQIRAVDVGTFEEDGRHKTFSPLMQFASIPMAGVKGREYSVLLVLAEEDVSGGTDEFVAKLLKDANDGNADDGKADGGAAAVAGEVAKEIAKELAKRGVERLKSNAKDDIFAPRAVSVTLRESDLRFADGATTTAPQTLTFSGHAGKYAVTYSWKRVS